MFFVTYRAFIPLFFFTSCLRFHTDVIEGTTFRGEEFNRLTSDITQVGLGEESLGLQR